jgi:hypothetical protein
MLKQRYVAPAALTAVTAATVVTRVRRHRAALARPHGIRRLVRRPRR